MLTVLGCWFGSFKVLGLRLEHMKSYGSHVSYSLNSFKGGYIGDNIGDYYRGYQGGY